MLLCRALLFYLGMTLVTLIVSPISIILYPLPFKLRYAFVSHWAVFNIWWLKLTCGLTHTVEGLENIPESPAIIMCKHQSAWETFVLQQIFPAQAWILKRELLWIPIYGLGLATLQPIAIDRGSAVKSLRQIVKQGCERLAQGIWVVIFPEGLRVAPGERTKYLPGGGLLAEKSGFPIVPIAHNSGYFWPCNSLIKKPGTINMIIGPLIETEGKSANDITAEVEEWIESTIEKLPTPENAA